MQQLLKTLLRKEAKSMELFKTVMSCVGSRHTLNMVENVYGNNIAGLECVTEALKDWCLDGNQTDTMNYHWENKPHSLDLYPDTSCIKYVNNFGIYV